ESWASSILPSRETSWSVRLPVTRTRMRRLPESDTAYKARLPPDSAAENQISFPFGDQARPPSVEKSPASLRGAPEASTTSADPPSSATTGWCRNATLRPSNETLGFVIHPLVLNRTLPAGYSSCICGPTARTTASDRPSGDQSAHCTSSCTSRG